MHPDAQAVAQIGEADDRPKDECWYVVGSENGSLCKGLKPGVTPGQFREAVLDDSVDKFVNRVFVKPGDFHYVPSGTVHALGPGVLAVEIQTPSDTTYRVTDWGRGRDIHLEQSLQIFWGNMSFSTVRKPSLWKKAALVVRAKILTSP